MTKSENVNLVLGREEVYKASPCIWSFKYTNDIVNGMNPNLSNMVVPIPLSVEATRGKILMICRDCIINGTESVIDFDLLRNAHIHIFGKPLQIN